MYMKRETNMKNMKKKNNLALLERTAIPIVFSLIRKIFGWKWIEKIQFGAYMFKTDVMERKITVVNNVS